MTELVELTAEEIEIRDAAWRENAGRFGVPPRLRDASFRSRATPALECARQYVTDDFAAGRCLVLAGPTGVGKSWAAAAAIRAVSNTSTPSESRRFCYFPALCGQLLVPGSRESALEYAKSCPFLVVDDLGTEYVKEGGLVDAFLDEIVWHRESWMRSTIITTNLTTDGLKARLSARLVDRLRGEWGRIYEVPGESLR